MAYAGSDRQRVLKCGQGIHMQFRLYYLGWRLDILVVGCYLVPEGVSVKACSFINRKRKDVSHQRTSGLGSINNLWASDEVLQAAYFGFGTDYAGSWFR